jgi:serine/threonine-protein kinase RsbW
VCDQTVVRRVGLETMMSTSDARDVGRAALDVTLPAEASCVAQARALVAELLRDAGLTGRCGDVALALSEACGNVVLHAYYPDDPDPTVRIAARTAGSSLVLEVEDRGRGLRSHHSDPGLGLGLDLIRRLADDARFEGRPGGGTSVSMTFRISPTSLEPARYA